MITQAKTELDSLKTISEEHARSCAGLKGSIGDRSNHSNIFTSEFGQNSCQNSGTILTFLQKSLKF